MKEKEIVEKEENILENDKGFAMMYNITMVSAVATVIMFVIGTALYLTVVGQTKKVKKMIYSSFEDKRIENFKFSLGNI